MGDNVYLGDRNGVRTPMQWSSDRNAGFSRTDPARLYAPVIMDSVYGYESINVESQERSPVLAAAVDEADDRAPQAASGVRPRVAPVHPDRGTARCSCTCAATSRTSSCASPTSRERCSRWRFRSAEFAGLTPVELLGQTEFPRIGEQPYFLTLAPYGFYWFQLQEAVVPITARTAPVPDDHAALPSLFVGVVWDSVLDGGLRSIIERQALVPFLRAAALVRRQRRARWRRRASSTGCRCGAAPTRRSSPSSKRSIATAAASAMCCRWRCRAIARPPSIERERSTAVLARITGARKGLLHDGLLDDGTCQMLLAAVQRSPGSGDEARQPAGVASRFGDRLGVGRGPDADRAIRARPEQHVGAVRQAHLHEGVPPHRTGPESRHRDRRVSRRTRLRRVPPLLGSLVIRSRRPTSRPRSPCCRDTSSTRATGGR